MANSHLVVSSLHVPHRRLDGARAIRVMELVADELISATRDNAKFNSFHEGYAVILEELDELWDEVKLKTPDSDKVFREAIQVSAMGMRFVHDLNGWLDVG